MGLLKANTTAVYLGMMMVEVTAVYLAILKATKVERHHECEITWTCVHMI